MTSPQRAFLNAQIALSAWRAARDAEAQVAHWLTEGRATREELIEYRKRSKLAHEAHRRAQRAYSRACEQITLREERSPRWALEQTLHLEG